MSHFTLLVTGDDVDAQLAPYDENKQVPRYKDYEDGDPASHYSVKVSREDGLLPADGELTWEQVADALNKRHKLLPDNSDYLFVDEQGAYQWRTYNPDSKWDYYTLGGRWSGYFPLMPGLVTGSVDFQKLINAGEILAAEPTWSQLPGYNGGVDHSPKPFTVNGGLRKHLDFESMRATKAAEAGRDYDDYYAALTPVIDQEAQKPFVPWSSYVARVQAKMLSIDEARDLYHAQPRCALFGQPELRKTYGWSVEHEDYLVDREVFVERARARAVPAYALLHQGEWIAPGQMGWFGMSSDEQEDRDAYNVKVNELLDGLAPDTMITMLDLHI